jgi:hypothetical protein
MWMIIVITCIKTGDLILDESGIKNYQQRSKTMKVGDQDGF